MASEEPRRLTPPLYLLTDAPPNADGVQEVLRRFGSPTARKHNVRVVRCPFCNSVLGVAARTPADNWLFYEQRRHGRRGDRRHTRIDPGMPAIEWGGRMHSTGDPYALPHTARCWRCKRPTVVR